MSFSSDVKSHHQADKVPKKSCVYITLIMPPLHTTFLWKIC